MLLTENNLRTIINTMLTEAKKFSQFVEEAMAEKQRNNNTKNIILNGAIEYLRGAGVNTIEDLEEFIVNKIDSRPNRKFDEYILKILYSLDIADPTGLVSRNINDLSVLINALYQQGNSSIIKNYNEILLTLRMIYPGDNRDISSKLIKSNLPGVGNDQNGIPKSTIILYSEVYGSEAGNSNLLNKLVEGLESVIEVKSYAGYPVEIINYGIQNGGLTVVAKKDNVTIFEINDYTNGMLIANNIYPMKKEYSKTITSDDSDNSQYLDTISSRTNFINDYKHFNNLRPPADWCVKAHFQYVDYLSKVGGVYDDPDPNAKNKFYLVLDNSKPASDEDGACLALVLHKNRLTREDVAEYTRDPEIFEKYLYENFSSITLLEKINIILRSGFDIFYYDIDNNQFAHYNKRSSSFIKYNFNSSNKILNSEVLFDSEILQSSKFEFKSVGIMLNLKEIRGAAFNIFKNIFLVKKEESLKYESFAEYYAYAKDIIYQTITKDIYDPDFTRPVISAVTWRITFVDKARAYTEKDNVIKNIDPTNEYYIYDILNYSDSKLSNESNIKYNNLFKEIGIEPTAQNDPEAIIKSNANTLPPFEEVIEYAKNNHVKYRTRSPRL